MLERPLETRTGILIVEDEPIIAADLALKLQELGYEIAGAARSGKEAIRIAEASRPGLVMMDIFLPGGMDGVAAATEIRRRWNIPVVFVTANKDEAIITRAKEANPVAYLTKPFRADELNATLAVALHQHHFTQRLFEEQVWLSTILGSIRDGVIATDADGRVRYINGAAELLTGWERSEAFGRPIDEVYHPLASDGESDIALPVSQAPASIPDNERAQFLLESLSGRRLIIEETTSPICDAEGQLAGAVTVFQDITLRISAERARERLLAELQRSNAELAQFSYSVSHDLQEPLRTIRSFSELLTRGSAQASKEGEPDLLRMISGAADHMQQLITSLLGYAQVGERKLNPESIHLQVLIEGIRTNLASALRNAGATLTCGDLPTIYGDRVQLDRVFQNLIANAILYSRPDIKPVVHISGEPVQRGWCLQVADNGAGIPPDLLEKVFEPLNRLHGNESSGTGLGLAMCRMIVNRHGGRIWANSKGLNQGSTFSIFLPSVHDNALSAKRNEIGEG